MIDVTLVIPTHKRHKLLKRAIDYYSTFPIQIIIVDSSPLAINDRDLKSNNIKYISKPGMYMCDKIIYALRCVKTKYVNLCADDDFLIYESIAKGAKFLDEFKEFSSVMGAIVLFKKNQNRLTVRPDPHLVETRSDYCAINSNPIERVKKVFMNMHEYALYRTDILYKCIEPGRNTKPVSTFHYFTSAISALYGMHKNLDLIWMARDMEEYTNYYRSESSEEYTDSSIIQKIGFYTSTVEGGEYFQRIIKIFINQGYDKNEIENMFDKLICERDKKSNSKLKKIKKFLKNNLSVDLYNLYVDIRDSNMYSKYLWLKYKNKMPKSINEINEVRNTLMNF